MDRKLRRLAWACVLAGAFVLVTALALNLATSALASNADPSSRTGQTTRAPQDQGPQGKKPGQGKPHQPNPNQPDAIAITDDIRNQKLPLSTESLSPLDKAAAKPEYNVGDTRRFVILDDYFGRYRLADFEVRLISDTVEVWVQKDLRFRNPDLTINPIHPEANLIKYVDQARINYLAAETARIIAKDVEYFGDYKSRTGAQAALPGQVGLPADYYTGPGKRVIVLVSNVRDANYYDPVNNPTRIVGFYSPTLNAFADRNIITIDSSRWNIWVGPPQYQFEATIAHEFQHLINQDYDNAEPSWTNEGRSEYAEFLMGYRPTPEDHRTTWSDYPENSLTLWGDQDNDPDQPGYEITADYQIAYWFQLYLAGRLQAAGIDTQNEQFLLDVSRVTTDPLPGAEAIDAMLQRVGAPFRFRQLWRDFRIDMLHGGTSDQTAWGNYISRHQGLSGVPIAPLDLGRLRRNLNFEGYDQPGVAADSTDYLEIGWSPAITSGTSVNFQGNNAPLPTDWHVIPAASTGITPTLASGNVLYSGHTDLTDNFLVFNVTVPITGNQTLAFDTLYNIENHWDFGFVQVTTDTVGAKGFVSLPISGTTSTTDPDAHPIIKANVPGFTGVSNSEDNPAWVHVTYNLSAYAGKTILLAFRYATDWGTGGTIDPPPDAGWYLDNIKIGDQALYTDEAAVPAGAKSIWQLRNIRGAFDVNFVTFPDKNGIGIGHVYTMTLDANAQGTFNFGSLLNDPGFNEAGERVIGLVSLEAPASESDLVSTPTTASSYRLTGLPPSVYTSRARAIGTSSDTNVGSPKVFPGDAFTMTVTVDDLGRAPDLSAAPTQAYVAVPVPPQTTFVPGTLHSTVAQGAMTYTTSLHRLDAALPDAPGVYWHGTVTRTADLAFQLRATQPISIGTVLTPTAHIANGPFSANPSQYFTDSLKVTVSSPFALSSATASPSVRLGNTAVFTYTLINTDDAPRDVDMRVHLPDGVTLERVDITQQDAGKTEPNAQDLTLHFTVPSYIQTKKVTVVSLTLRVSPFYAGRTVNPMVELLQPNSNLSWVSLPLDVPGGATAITGVTRLFLPHISVGMSRPTPSTPNVNP